MEWIYFGLSGSVTESLASCVPLQELILATTLWRGSCYFPEPAEPWRAAEGVRGWTQVSPGAAQCHQADGLRGKSRARGRQIARRRRAAQSDCLVRAPTALAPLPLADGEPSQKSLTRAFSGTNPRFPAFSVAASLPGLLHLPPGPGLSPGPGLVLKAQRPGQQVEGVGAGVRGSGATPSGRVGI